MLDKIVVHFVSTNSKIALSFLLMYDIFSVIQKVNQHYNNQWSNNNNNTKQLAFETIWNNVYWPKQSPIMTNTYTYCKQNEETVYWI